MSGTVSPVFGLEIDTPVFEARLLLRAINSIARVLRSNSITLLDMQVLTDYLSFCAQVIQFVWVFMRLFFRIPLLPCQQRDSSSCNNEYLNRCEKTMVMVTEGENSKPDRCPLNTSIKQNFGSRVGARVGFGAIFSPPCILLFLGPDQLVYLNVIHRYSERTLLRNTQIYTYSPVL